MAGQVAASNSSPELARTIRAQSDAADPRACVWVSANAGTGKTHVLTMRVLRLLLGNTAPSRILCLTYTKAAAAEMSKRVFDVLAGWVVLPPDKLSTALQELTGAKPSAGELSLARTLFTSAIETPGGLKVQTIHAFCERLLQRFPLEAGVSPGFAILDESMARKLRREAIDDMLTLAVREPSSELGQALKCAIGYAADDRFDEILDETVQRHREWLSGAGRLTADSARGLSGFGKVRELFDAHLGVRPNARPLAIATELAKLVPDDFVRRVCGALSSGSTNDVKLGLKLGQAVVAANLSARSAAVHAFFTKNDGEPRDKFFTKGLAAQHPELDARLTSLQARVLELCAELKACEAIEATMALHHLADRVMQNYADAKARRAALDFDDLTARTAALLASSSSPEWVLYKLDNGLDHILVDESQDTSPEQWKIVQALAQEFFSGRGGSETVRTIFAVGDEKQSIYSFQGAAPEMFAQMGQVFEQMARDAKLDWRAIPLNRSFRTVAPVLSAVDRVFGDASLTPGVTPDGGQIAHVANRKGHAGLIELWSTEAYRAPPETDAWSPLDETVASAPAVRLAAEIAATIKSWLDTGERLASEDRPIAEGDILILVRKRNPFAGPMVAALKAAGIKVAGADRIRLSEQIAIEDLMSLGDFLTLPEDDLALAEILNSPLFGFGDEDLFDLAASRKGTLWQSLLKAADAGSRYAPAAAMLKKWRKMADFIPPFEFFAGVLDGDGMRRKLIERLGPDATDPIDEFLNLALTYDDGAPPSLSGFLAWVREGDREIKRDMEHGRNEVRVITVHGAKGLEAPIVFLPDTCSAGSAGRQGGKPLPLDMPRPMHLAVPFFWPVKGASKLDRVVAALAALNDRDQEERDRLLYVAMTRARDRLYIAGFEGKKGRAPGCWYDTIETTLAPILEKASGRDGAEVRRLKSAQEIEPEAPKTAMTASLRAMALPDWARSPAPREPHLALPLAPSRLAPYESDESGEPLPKDVPVDRWAEPAAGSPLSQPARADAAPAIKDKFLRGTLTHALLQYLPDVAAANRASAAQAYVSVKGANLSRATQRSICSETLAILNDVRFAPLFGPQSQAEVPLVAEIPRPAGLKGPPLKLTGQIDRLAVTDTEVLIVDYKTNREAPANIDGVAEAYLFQLAAYRMALSLIFKGKAVRACLLWTEGATIIDVPLSKLDEFTDRLWQLESSRLDA